MKLLESIKNYCSRTRPKSIFTKNCRLITSPHGAFREDRYKNIPIEFDLTKIDIYKKLIEESLERAEKNLDPYPIKDYKKIIKITFMIDVFSDPRKLYCIEIHTKSGLSTVLHLDYLRTLDSFKLFRNNKIDSILENP